MSRFLDWLQEKVAASEGAALRRIDGFPVVVINTREDIDTRDVLARIERVLALTARTVPRRYARMKRDVSRILVQRYACRAAYDPETRTCLLELTFCVNPEFSDAQVASSLVHEAMHARVRGMGVTVTPDMKAHEERLCREAELELGLALGDDAVITRARNSLALADEEVAPSIDWEEAARRVAEADRAARARS